MTTELTAAAAPPADPGWVVLGDGGTAARARPAFPSVGRVVRRFVLANLAAVVLLLAGGLWAGVEAAEDEALADARRTTDLLADVLVQPSSTSGCSPATPRRSPLSTPHCATGWRRPPSCGSRSGPWTAGSSTPTRPA